MNGCLTLLYSTLQFSLLDIYPQVVLFLPPSASSLIFLLLLHNWLAIILVDEALGLLLGGVVGWASTSIVAPESHRKYHRGAMELQPALWVRFSTHNLVWVNRGSPARSQHTYEKGIMNHVSGFSLFVDNGQSLCERRTKSVFERALCYTTLHFIALHYMPHVLQFPTAIFSQSNRIIWLG